MNRLPPLWNWSELNFSKTMWRFPKRLNHNLSGKVQKVLNCKRDGNFRVCQVRLYATPVPPATGGGGRIILGFLGATFLGSGGAVIYAKLDSGFRSWIEEKVPYSDVLLQYIIGENTEARSTKSSGSNVLIASQKPAAATSSGLLQKKLDREAAKKDNEESAVPASQSVVKEVTKTEEPKAQVKVEKTLPSETKPSTPVVSDAELQKRITSQDVVSAAENTAIEVIVKDSIKDLNLVLASTLSAYHEALEAVQSHIENLQKAMDVPQGESHDAVWSSVNLALNKKSEAIAKAEKQGEILREAVQKTKKVVQEGRKSKITSYNPALISAEEIVNKAIYDLHNVESQVTVAQSESNILSNYKALIEQGREQFEKEMKSLSPDVKLGEKGKKLSEEELNNLIAYAHKKIEQLQKLLSAQQIGEKQRVQLALENQRKEYDKLINSRLSGELDRQQRELQILFQKKLNGLKEDFEQELLQQLRRQAAAHSEHLRDVVVAQEKDFQAKHERYVEEKVGEARHEFQKELAGSLGRLKGIEKSLKARSELDASWRKAQRLWVACQSLKYSTFVGKSNAKSWEEQRKPLAPDVDAILKSAGLEDAFVQIVVKSIPAEALTKGVYTEEALKDRFLKVDRVCRYTAMIGSQGANLFKYALSYLQAVFLVRNSEKELTDDPVDISKLNTFDILDRAKWYVDRGDFEQALRYMSLLSGTPGKVASDWLNQTRMLLEVRLTIDALVARIAASEAQVI